MPWTLYRYILRELILILLICTAVMVTVLSFFIAIKPLSDGLLDAMSLVKFVLYTMPTVLGFALPFAGAFASTLVFLRMAGDNEITACAASGLSYFRVLMPVVMLGIVLMVVLLYLSNFVIPGYYKKATRTVQADALTLIESQLNDGVPVKLQRYVLYAESARSVPSSEIDASAYPFPPEKVMQLTGVVFGQADAQDKLRWDYTASRASALLFRRGDRSWITIRLRDSVYYDPTAGRMQRAVVDPLDLGPIEPPNPFEDDPRFMSYTDLMALDKNPERYKRVADGMRFLTIALGQERLRQRFETDAVTQGVELVGPLTGEVFRIEAGSTRRESEGVRLLGSPERPVQVMHDRRGERVWTIRARDAFLRFEASEFDTEPAVLMELNEARVYDPGPDLAFTEHPTLSLPRMRWPRPLLDIDRSPAAVPAWKQLREMSSRPPYQQDRLVENRSNNLRLQLERLAMEVIAEKHQRAALAVAGFLLLVLGAVLSIYLRHQMTLVVFFWSFVLAIVSLVLIHSGARVVGHAKLAPGPGLALMWTGNVVLSIVAGWVYCRFAKN